MSKLLLLFLIPFAMEGDISLLLHESTGTGAARFTDAGHAAIYFSNVCAETAVKLRICEPGEAGAVVSNNSNFGEVANYEWNAAPLTMYLYGVENPGNTPLYATLGMRRELQERYRRRSLRSLCPEVECAWGDGRWRDMAGQLFMRDIYALRAKTTPAQDQEFVRGFNAAPNTGRYNGFTRNCADFARNVMNQYFPGSARADHLNDFGMTSPKAIAKSVTKYGHRHPELEFVTEKYVQLDGPIRRSTDNRKGTEVGFRSKKWLLPLLLCPHELGLMVAAYFVTGRYSPEGEYERTATHMTEDVWEDYGRRFETILAKAMEQGVITSERDVKGVFRELERTGTPSLTEGGIPYLQTSTSRLYLTRSTILSDASDPRLAYRLLLAKVNDTLHSPLKNREAPADFRATWDLLQTASRQPAAIMRDSAAGQ